MGSEIKKKIKEEIEHIRNEIEQGKPPQNEAHTCIVVINPLIYASGYTSLDVLPSGTDAAGSKPDYTVMPYTEYKWYIEAKDWSVQLKPDHVTQALNYANQNGKKWVVLTNGEEWRLYDNSIMGESKDKEVCTARLDNPDELAELLTALSKDSVESGGLEEFAKRARARKVLDCELKDEKSQVVNAIVNVLKKEGIPGVKPADVAGYFMSIFRENREQVEQKPSITNEPKPDGTFNLVELSKKYLNYSKPETVYFPGGSSVNVSSWKDATIKIVEHIFSIKGVPKLPFKSGGEGGFRCFLNSEPVYHSDGEPMKLYGVIDHQGMKVYVDIKRSASNFIRQLIGLCKAAELPPEDFRIDVEFRKSS